MDFRVPQHRRSVDCPYVCSALRSQHLHLPQVLTGLLCSRSSSRTARLLPLPPLPPLWRNGGALECWKPGLDMGLDTGLDMCLNTGGDELEVGGAELEMGGYGFDTDG